MIILQENKVFINDRNIWTSGGVTTGIDLSLSLVEADLGADIAKSIEKVLVVYYRHPGDQQKPQYCLIFSSTSDRIKDVLAYMREKLPSSITIQTLA